MRYGFLIVLFISIQAIAQQGQQMYKVYRTNEGVSNNTVLCMLKDARGFIWAGTTEGLNRFDGYSFKHFFSDRTNPQSLNDSYIWDILEYKPNKLLIATNDGVSILNAVTSQFENDIVKFPALKRGSNVGISSFFKHPDGSIWINHSGEIDVLDSNLIYRYRLTDKPWAKSLKGIDIKLEKWYLDSKQRLWLPSIGMGLCIADLANQKVISPGNNPLQYPFTGTSLAIRSFYYDETGGVVWYATWSKGLYKYKLATKQLQQQLFGMKMANELRNVNLMVLDKLGQLLCGVSNHIFIVDTATLQYKELKNFNKKDDTATPITYLKDSSGVTWLGGTGLVKIIQGSAQLQQFYFNDYDISMNWEPTDYLWCRDVNKSGKNYYFSYGPFGLIELNIMDNTVRQYQFSSSSSFTGKACTGPDNKLLVSTSQGFKLFNAGAHTWEEENVLNSWFKKNNIPLSFYGQRCMFTDSKGNIWIGVDPTGIVRYNPNSGDFLYIRDYTKLVKSFFTDQYPIHRITEDEDGTIWFTSFHKGGLLSFQPQSGQWSLYPSKKYFNLLADKGINKVAPAGNHTLWVSSIFSHGLMNYDYKNDSISFVTRNEGLPSDNVQSITKDKNNNLILTTDKGIAYYNTHTGEINSQSFKENGISTEFIYVNYYDSSHNALLYGLADRLVLINKNFLGQEKAPDKPVIDKLMINSVPVSFTGNELKLDHTQKNINIDFTSISFDENTSLQYIYKLEGFDKEWKKLNQSSAISYTNLPPGNYTLLLKAGSQSGKWGPVNDELKFQIQPAFWQTAWFWGLIILTIAGVSIVLVSQRINSIRKKAVLKQKVAETEMQALRAQMNPHFIFNCLSAIDNLVQTNQREKATIYLGRFARLFRIVLDSLKYNTVAFQKDFESLNLYLQMEQFRCGNKFDYELTATDELLHSDYRVPPLIVQPFVENAVQHGLLNKQNGERKLFVKVALVNDYIKYTVTDNGVGRIKAKELKEINKPEHQSFGITITTERVHLYNQGIQNGGVIITDLIENNRSSGTKVEVFLRVYDRNETPNA